jgi:hypothetical protein
MNGTRMASKVQDALTRDGGPGSGDFQKLNLLFHDGSHTLDGRMIAGKIRDALMGKL